MQLSISLNLKRLNWHVVRIYIFFLKYACMKTLCVYRKKLYAERSDCSLAMGIFSHAMWVCKRRENAFLVSGLSQGQSWGCIPQHCVCRDTHVWHNQPHGFAASVPPSLVHLLLATITLSAALSFCHCGLPTVVNISTSIIPSFTCMHVSTEIFAYSNLKVGR